jgi:hypothetical protein
LTPDKLSHCSYQPADIGPSFAETFACASSLLVDNFPLDVGCAVKRDFDGAWFHGRAFRAIFEGNLVFIMAMIYRTSSTGSRCIGSEHLDYSSTLLASIKKNNFQKQKPGLFFVRVAGAHDIENRHNHAACVTHGTTLIIFWLHSKNSERFLVGSPRSIPLQ